MSNCGCRPTPTTERKVLVIALILNLTMFLVGLIAGILADSISLLADSFDMLADASAYTIGLFAIGRSLKFKTGAARLSGILLLILGFGVLVEVAYRGWLGSFPEGHTMIVVAIVSLTVNTYVLHKLGQFRQGEAHLRASWIFTRADIIVNIGVICSGILVALTNSHYPDLVVGFIVGLYVIKEAIAILRDN
ncbi:MAG: hypothetical protein CK423_08280 [Legionella sp.]|nr:MAG: hypothetical protein CK423_08280 [Legionella sp.]